MLKTSASYDAKLEWRSNGVNLNNGSTTMIRRDEPEPNNPNDLVSGIIYVLLAAAQGGGMSDETAQTIYDEIVKCYRTMNEDTSMAILGDIHTILKGERS